MNQLSIVGREYQTEDHVIGYYNAGERIRYWGESSAFWGGTWGLLFGSAFFLVPGIGPLVVAGPLVSWIVESLKGAVTVGGLTPVGTGICSLGIPKDSVVHYESAIKYGKFLLIAHANNEDVFHAHEIISSTEPDVLADHKVSHSNTEAVLVT